MGPSACDSRLKARRIVVVGPPGADCAGVAQSVAEKRACRVVSVDGQSIESELRSASGAVLVLNPEAWLDHAFRVRLMDRCLVVAILPSDFESGGGLDAKMWARFRGDFLESHRCFEAGAGGIVEEIVDLSLRDPVGVAVGERSYLVQVGRGFVDQYLASIVPGAGSHLWVTDSNVDRIYGARFGASFGLKGAQVRKVVFEAGEKQKTLQTLSSIYEAAQSIQVDRSSRLFAIGGGVVTDMGGLAAATWMRGIKWFGISTTLLSMVDASVGGKTAVDFGEGKNAVGVFWQPSGVACDTELLATENRRNYQGALAEVIKTAIIGDVELFEMLERETVGVLSRDADLMAEVVRRCIRVKSRIVGEDEREHGVRATLNLGHTVGHALEAQCGFEKWTHGEAVSLGLVAALRLGVRRGVTDSALAERVTALLGRLELPIALDRGDLEAAANVIGHDKKRAGHVMKFIFAEALGRVRVDTLEMEELRSIVPALADADER